MTYVITQSCCNDGACTSVCPVDCIHPTPEERAYARTEMLYIDPDSCIDCGSCVAECPVDAIYSDHDLPTHLHDYLAINAAFFDGRTLGPVPRRNAVPPRVDKPLRVAIVGSGPAGAYTATELVAVAGPRVTVDIFDRLPTPWGLVRYGVAPDHLGTKAISRMFAELGENPRATFHLAVEVGTHVSLGELREHYDAVVLAHGAPASRRLGIPGEDLPGSASATDFVAWYNGHPDAADRTFPLTGSRAVVIGNGNVALDVARLLMSGPEQLRHSDMAEHARLALSANRLIDVTVVGRRGVLNAACSLAELAALDDLDGVDVRVDPEDLVLGPDGQAALAMDPILRLKYERFCHYGRRAATSPRPISFLFDSTPQLLLGEDRVEAIQFAHPSRGTEVLAADFVLLSIGYTAVELPGVPFDDRTRTLPSTGFRVTTREGEVLPGLYAAGWIARGPSGVMGTNKQDARAVVAAIVEDARQGRLRAPTAPVGTVHELVRARQPAVVTWQDWLALDQHELRLGNEQGRPRVKVVGHDEQVEVAHHAHPATTSPGVST